MQKLIKLFKASHSSDSIWNTIGLCLESSFTQILSQKNPLRPNIYML